MYDKNSTKDESGGIVRVLYMKRYNLNVDCDKERCILYTIVKEKLHWTLIKNGREDFIQDY